MNLHHKLTPVCRSCLADAELFIMIRGNTNKNIEAVGELAIDQRSQIDPLRMRQVSQTLLKVSAWIMPQPIIPPV
jgi:hypothetical protein